MQLDIKHHFASDVVSPFDREVFEFFGPALNQCLQSANQDLFDLTIKFGHPLLQVGQIIEVEVDDDFLDLL